MADFDVLTMAGLVRWVAVTTERLGPNRTEILLDAFESAGRIAPATRMVLHHLMALSEEDPSENVPVREIVSAMVRMEGVLDTNTGSESSRLLSMLMDVVETFSAKQHPPPNAQLIRTWIFESYYIIVYRLNWTGIPDPIRTRGIKG